MKHTDSLAEQFEQRKSSFKSEFDFLQFKNSFGNFECSKIMMEKVKEIDSRKLFKTVSKLFNDFFLEVKHVKEGKFRGHILYLIMAHYHTRIDQNEILRTNNLQSYCKNVTVAHIRNIKKAKHENAKRQN